ncbi:Uncharacterised protein [Burkholderia pseudomallei]|uniref:hypothetical protein n=1 Tax=Burkholderia pseudomallei TaxID=28450 RepID=UPI00097781BE|nr:hypothetical protein [Burkholderia pseudomallei]MBF4045246.1 hypothetical protein [Burkholderia pseudomallei]CAJ3547167.1 Uncharacterised protein [Burkholderia pseudomallei]CAJ4987836.1 Uncharacterised protein [Burkholderia pseudomallei]CAJ5305568.1 Uncharacterised protein [Burkholderia pseudomallei]CAJ6650282.1 Uncharacterised protein [Burkholderia pseudomallei]
MNTPNNSSRSTTRAHPHGVLAWRYTGKRLPLHVLRSVAGYYIGTADDEGPVSRESLEYFPTHELAIGALASDGWTQRFAP